MTESAGADGAAHDATARVGPASDGDPLRRLQLADLEARQTVERMEEKLAKIDAHRLGVLESLADAEAEAARAAAALDAHPNDDPEAVA